MASVMILRQAREADIPALQALVEASVRELGRPFYSRQQIEQSLVHVFGVDRQLIADGTYYVVDADGEIVGCGGWSQRKTPFGGDQASDVRDATLRTPGEEPAVLRAFFVHPEWTRRGIGRWLVTACETRARRAGFTCFELVSTLSGRPLYAALGYREGESMAIPLAEDVVLEAVRMKKP